MASMVACVGCKKDETASEGGDVAVDGSHRAKREPARVEAVELPALGEPPGLLADGVMFAAVRAGATQDFLHRLPLPGSAARELAEARRELGFDPFTDDVLARFSIPPDAVISMTLGRPLGVESRKVVTKAIHHRDERFLGLVARVMKEDAGLAVPKPPYPPEPWPEPEPEPEEELLPPKPMPIVFAPPTAVAEPEPPHFEEPPPPPDPIYDPIYEPVPPPISPADRSEIDTLLRESDAMGIQLRFHIPSDDPNKIFGELRTRVPAKLLAEGDVLCRGLEAAVCVGGNRALVIARGEAKAAVLDLVLFTGRSDRADVEARRGVVARAVEAPRAKLPVLAKMSGHASAYVDGPALVELVEHERVGQALRDLLWNDEQLAESVDRRIDEGVQMRRLLEAPRLFDGVLANVHHERDRTQLQLTWPLRDDQAALARSALSPPPLVVPVPSLAALCDDALLCARSRGLPSPQEIGTKLGMGVYGNARVLEDALDEADEMGLALLFVSTWPNALGTLLWQMPLAEARGAEAALVRGLLDAVSRIGGLGLSVRSLSVGRRSLAADYAVYARVPVNDLGLVGTLLSMAEMRLTPTTIDGVEGKIAMLRVPEDDFPAVLMTREDPDVVKNADDKEVRYGWLTVVDDAKRLEWLLGAPTDDGQEPLLYGEIPDLWKLVASVPDAVDELGFARTWATDRRLAGSLRLEDGQPHLLVEVALRAKSSAGPQ